ncbi:MAG: twin-arginine translocase TatA/TatE family subunit [Bacteroidales bacterium]|nr:twin-arginine translocase TatA/TatE family subunit [Bacteroidales bacterium]
MIMTLAVLGMFGHWEILVIVLIVLLLFGGRKIPEMMKGMGKGIRSFKKGMSGEDDEEVDNKELPKK